MFDLLTLFSYTNLFYLFLIYKFFSVYRHLELKTAHIFFHQEKNLLCYK